MEKINLKKNMELNEEIFQKKLNELIKDIFASAEAEVVMNETDSLYSYIKSKWNDLDFFKKFDEMINSLFIHRVLKEKTYVDGFLKKYLNIYFELLEIDFYSCWGLVFSKIFMSKDIEATPSVLPHVFRFIFPKLPKIFDDNDLIFPLDDGISLYDVIGSWLAPVEDQVVYSSSYDLFINSKLRNELILHLYKKYKETKTLILWFPFAGIGAEPMLISYLLHLVAEADTGFADMPNFFIHCGDHCSFIAERSLSSQLFDELLIRTKEDFCSENGIRTGGIKTTIKQAKRKLGFVSDDLIYKLEAPDTDFDTVIINSLKLADNETENGKLQKIIDRLERCLRDIEVIYEVRSIEPLAYEQLPLKKSYEKKIISESFISLKTDRNLTLVSLKVCGCSNDENVHVETIDDILIDGTSPDKDVLKNRILKIKINDIYEPVDKLKYAKLLALSGYYSRSFDMIKKYYKSAYSLSYSIMQEILSGSKNEKLNARIENFISENKIREKGFSGELLDAITEEMEEYFKRNPGTMLKKEKWIL